MAEHKRANGLRKASNKMSAAREIIRNNPGISAKQLKQTMEDEFGLKMTPKMAYNYRFKISQEVGSKKSVQAVGRPPMAKSAASNGSESGIDDLIRAAQSLGWKRVKTIAEGILGAPA